MLKNKGLRRRQTRHSMLRCIGPHQLCELFSEAGKRRGNQKSHQADGNANVPSSAAIAAERKGKRKKKKKKVPSKAPKPAPTTTVQARSSTFMSSSVLEKMAELDDIDKNYQLNIRADCPRFYGTDIVKKMAPITPAKRFEITDTGPKNTLPIMSTPGILDNVEEQFRPRAYIENASYIEQTEEIAPFLIDGSSPEASSSPAIEPAVSFFGDHKSSDGTSSQNERPLNCATDKRRASMLVSFQSDFLADDDGDQALEAPPSVEVLRLRSGRTINRSQRMQNSRHMEDLTQFEGDNGPNSLVDADKDKETNEDVGPSAEGNFALVLDELNALTVSGVRVNPESAEDNNTIIEMNGNCDPQNGLNASTISGVVGSPKLFNDSKPIEAINENCGDQDGLDGSAVSNVCASPELSNDNISLVVDANFGNDNKADTTPRSLEQTFDSEALDSEADLFSFRASSSSKKSAGVAQSSINSGGSGVLVSNKEESSPRRVSNVSEPRQLLFDHCGADATGQSSSQDDEADSSTADLDDDDEDEVSFDSAEDCSLPFTAELPRDSPSHDNVQCQSPLNCRTTISRQSILQFKPERLVYEACRQTRPLQWREAFTKSLLDRCTKIGEGCFGEVFRTLDDDDSSVALKVIPIEGDFTVNCEEQKKFCEILPEILISISMSDLRNKLQYSTPNFVEVKRVRCVRGGYPEQLLRTWDEYNERKGSENDRPSMFGDDQLYIVFVFADGGCDLEGVKLKSVKQAESIIKQVALTLAIAEIVLEFEHRDLHIGNILVKETDETEIVYTFNGQRKKLESHGVHVFIIDFTNSRSVQEAAEGDVVYTNLASDQALFDGDGDYQFDIYRKMRELNGNEWMTFHPKTNLYWVDYLLDKLISFKRYAGNRKMATKQAEPFHCLREGIEKYDGCKELVCNHNFFGDLNFA